MNYFKLKNKHIKHKNKLRSAFCAVFLVITFVFATTVYAIGLSSNGENWSSDINLNLFANPKYAGQKIISPGSGKTVPFKIKNEQDFEIDYILKLTDNWEGYMPLIYRIKNENSYLLGGENSWENINSKTQTTGTMAPGEIMDLTLEWEWPFYKNEQEDVRDTEIGNQSALSEKEYILTLSVIASAEDSSPTTDTSDKNENQNTAADKTQEKDNATTGFKKYTEKITEKLGKFIPTGESSFIIWGTVLIATMAVVIFIIFKKHKPSKNNK